MNFGNLDDKTSLNPINNLLIDKPLLKPIDLLVDRPVDPNVGKQTSKPVQPIVERFNSQSFDEATMSRDLSEPIVRPKVKPSVKHKDRVSKSMVDYEGGDDSFFEERDIKRKNVHSEYEDFGEEFPISHLLNELDNPDVVAKIKLIINDEPSINNERQFDNEKYSELELENESLREELEQARNEVKKLKKIAVNQKEEITEYMNKTETILTENKKMFSKIQNFEYDQKMFTLFTLLNPDVKLSLRGIFKIDTYENFIACGAQRSNIDSLWDFARIRVQNQQFDEIETLNQILLYFIDIFNQTSNTPTIKIQDVAIGKSFDTDAHIKSSDSVKPAGTINKIYLIGYQNVINDKILNKAIVLIGG